MNSLSRTKEHKKNEKIEKNQKIENQIGKNEQNGKNEMIDVEQLFVDLKDFKDALTVTRFVFTLFSFYFQFSFILSFALILFVSFDLSFLFFSIFTLNHN